MVDSTVAAFGGVDILVNCAAPVGSSVAFKLPEVTDDALVGQLDVKVLGYLRCIQAVAPHMMRNGWGRIINVSGLNARASASIIGSVRNVAVVALTKNAADELGPHGINVTVVHPGLTLTEHYLAEIDAQAAAEGVERDELVKRRFAQKQHQARHRRTRYCVRRGLPGLAQIGRDQWRRDRCRGWRAGRYPLLNPTASGGTTMAASLSRQLAGWVAGLRFEDLPPEVVDRARGLTLHGLASALVGHDGAAPLQALRLMQEEEAGGAGGRHRAGTRNQADQGRRGVRQRRNDPGWWEVGHLPHAHPSGVRHSAGGAGRGGSRAR